LDKLAELTGRENFSQFTREAVEELAEWVDVVEEQLGIDLSGRTTYNVGLNGQGKDIARMTGFSSRSEAIKIALWVKLVGVVSIPEARPTEVLRAIEIEVGSGIGRVDDRSRVGLESNEEVDCENG